MIDRVERLTNLLALLLETSRPLTLVEIAGELRGQYPEGEANRRAMFERDKAALRGIGVPIETAVRSGEDAGVSEYWIDRERYELADLALEPDETRALQTAFATIRSASGGEIAAGELALWKLGATSADAELPVVAHVPELSALPTLRDAAARRRTVTFRYHATPRHLDPFGVLLRNGFWYVIGREHEADQQRTYRVDRIEGDVAITGADHAFERPVGFDPRDQLPSDAKRVGVGDAVVVDAVVRVSAARAAMIEREVGSEHVLRRHADGAVDVVVPCANVGAFETWVLGLTDHAEVLGPPEVRAALIGRLTALADGPPTAMSPGGRGPLGADARLSRLLVLLPWLMERHEVPIAEVAAAFRMTPAEVTAELELASMCGLPPFVDEMIDIFVDEDTVFVGVPRLFTKPLRLTAPEGFALLAAGRAAMQLPGADPDGPLGRGLAKLAAALGEEPDDAALVMDLAATPLVDVLVAAAVVGERLRIRYWTASRDEVTERTIVPRRVFHERGDWFVSADDERSGEERTFRADRIEQLDRTGEIVPRAGGADPLDRAGGRSVAWISDGSVPRVTLRLRPGARWVREQYPVDRVTELDDGVVDVVMAVTSERWLERLLLRAGTDAEVLAPAEWIDLGARGARRLLARYATPPA